MKCFSNPPSSTHLHPQSPGASKPRVPSIWRIWAELGSSWESIPTRDRETVQQEGTGAKSCGYVWYLAATQHWAVQKETETQNVTGIL